MGHQKTYGSSAVVEEGEVTWVLMVDWDNDGIYDGTNEADRLVGMKLKRGTKHYLAQSGNGFARMVGGKAILTLENYDRRYDPRYSSSPLYPNVEPGKQVYLRVIENDDQTSHDVLKGVIADIRPLSGGGGGDRVRIVVNDYMQELWETECTETASKAFVDLDESFIAVLDDINFKGSVDIDADSQPVPMLDIADKNAGTVVNQLAHAGLGYFFVDKLGVAKYYWRNHTSYTNHSIDEDVCLKEILVSQPWDYVYNHVNVTIHRPIWKQPSTIYSLPNPEAINTGTNVTIRCKYKLSKDIEIGEYEANTLKDNNGTDITDDITIVSQSFSQSGGTIVLSTSTNGYITRLEVNGRMLQELKEDSVHTDTTSIADYGLKKLKVDSPFMQDPHYANVFSEVIKDVTKNDREGVTIEIQQRPDYQYPIDIMHSVALTAATLDLNDTYYITGYEHRWNGETGQDVTTTMWLHSIITDNTAISDSEIETETYVPPNLENPDRKPWLPPPEPPPPGVPTYGYVFIPALGGDDQANNPLVWGNLGAGTDSDEYYFGLDFGDTAPHDGMGFGFFIVPPLVSSVEFDPIFRMDGGAGSCNVSFQANYYDTTGTYIDNIGEWDGKLPGGYSESVSDIVYITDARLTVPVSEGYGIDLQVWLDSDTYTGEIRFWGWRASLR